MLQTWQGKELSFLFFFILFRLASVYYQIRRFSSSNNDLTAIEHDRVVNAEAAGLGLFFKQTLYVLFSGEHV